MKCGAKHCFHGGEVAAEEAIKVGTRYYHKDCYRAKQDTKTIAELYVDEVDPNVIYNNLWKVINRIVYTQNINSSYVLFALRRHLRLQKPLNYPEGLYYVIKDRDALKEWKQLQNKKIKESINVDIEEMPEVSEINYKPQKPKGFGDILRGG